MVDDVKVQRLVTEAWTRSLGDAERAWQELYQRRNDPADPRASTDVDLAAAEHYLLTRYWVGTGLYGAAQTRLLTHTYHVAKRVLPESWLRHDPQRPATPPSERALSWALKGIVDGEGDRLRAGIPEATRFKSPPAYNARTQSYQKGYDAYGCER